MFSWRQGNSGASFPYAKTDHVGRQAVLRSPGHERLRLRVAFLLDSEDVSIVIVLVLHPVSSIQWSNIAFLMFGHSAIRMKDMAQDLVQAEREAAGHKCCRSLSSSFAELVTGVSIQVAHQSNTASLLRPTNNQEFQECMQYSEYSTVRQKLRRLD